MAQQVGLSPQAAARLQREVERLSREVRQLRAQIGRNTGGSSLPWSVVVGKTDAAHNKGATGTISIWNTGAKGSEADSTNNITGVYNRFADVASGKWVIVAYFDGDWELIAAEC